MMKKEEHFKTINSNIMLYFLRKKIVEYRFFKSITVYRNEHDTVYENAVKRKFMKNLFSRT